MIKDNIQWGNIESVSQDADVILLLVNHNDKGFDPFVFKL